MLKELTDRVNSWVQSSTKLSKAIFIEGPSGAGKTTTVNHLSDLLKIDKFKVWQTQRPMPHKDIMDVTQSTLYVMDFMRQVPCTVLHDRSFISAMVYDPHLPVQHKQKRYELFLSLAKDENLDCLFVFLDPPIGCLIQSAREADDELARQINQYTEYRTKLMDAGITTLYHRRST